MKGTKEFEDLMTQFEKDFKQIIYGHEVQRVSKDDKVPVDVFYHNGHINILFTAYMYGYQLRKSIEQLNTITKSKGSQ